MIAYEDFWLKIEPVDQNGWFPVLVVKSPAGEGRSYFQIPFSPDELADIQTSSHQLDSERFSEIGTLLFDALFTGPVLSLFDQSMGRTGERDRGLRIRLNIDPEEPSLAQLTGLPWEYLYRQETREFLNLSRFTPIVRHLNVQRSSAPQPLASPLRILVVISSPNDYDLLDLERERYIIETSWGKEADVQVDFLERATISALQDRLSEYSYHVLHFMGHGVFNQESGRGALLMEDERRRSVILDGPALGTLLHDAPTLRLVFLNACETATTTREDGFDPFTGVAAAIMMAGVPNAIAMQFPISDQAATTFARRFYATVAQGLPVDAAVAESRKSISLANTTSLEWGTPVLFIRSLDDLVLLPPLDKPAIPAGDQPPGIADAQPSGPMPQPSTGSTETNGTAAPAPATGMSRRTLGLVLMALALLVVVVIIGLQLFGGTPKQTASSAEALDVVATISSTDMAFVPAGTYTIGKADGGTLFVATEEHKIDAFWIDKYETTNSQYAAFLAATGSPPPGSWKGGNFPAGQADFPATGISWEQANAYCEWKQKRLPTEAEWEVAARGPRAWLYAWGDESLASAFHTTPTAVGTSLADQSYFGAFDMVHNVQEWVGEGYGPADETSPASRILRGGSFASPADLTQRFVGPGDGPMRIQVAGVRCAADSAAIDPASPPSDVLLQDDFSDPNTGWQIGPDTNPGYHAPDWYHLEAPDLEGVSIMLGLDNNSNLRDISVQSHLFYSKEQTHPDAQFRYGLVVRQSGENYYAFVINPRLKRWSVLRHGAEGMTELLQGVDAGMVTLETDAGRNMLRVDASGSTFAFAINGHLVTHFTDPDARLVGATGFFVESLNDQLSHIHVEELVVSRLPAEAIPGPSVQELANQQMELTVAENTPIPEPVALPDNPSSLGMERVEAASYPLGTDGETVTLDEFWIDRYEVTNAQYAQFIAATSLPAPSYWGNGNVPAGNEEYPVREVNWDSAKAYCTWAQKRLPTETEWEVAARGPFGWSYPWGRDGAIVSSSRLGGMHQVGMLLADRSYFGVYDMGGNVWEWVDEPFHPLPSGQRMLRGGSYSFPKTMTEFVTGDSNSEMLMQDAGFRCAASTVAFEPETLLPPSDQFQDVHSGWPQSIGDQPEYFYGYHPGDFYHLQVTVPNDCLTVVRDAPSANVMVEARIFVLASKDANGKSYQGITLRATEDRFYGFLVEPRLGVWRVERQSEEGTALIDSGSSVSIGGTDQITADRLLVVADGPTFLFFVNGELVSQIRDEAYREGGIGLIVKNGSQSYSHVHFDEIRVWEISPQMETGVAQWTESSAQISQTACRGRVRQDDLLGNFTVVRLDAQERPGVAVDIRELLSKQAAELGISVEELLKANSKTVDEIETVKIGDELIVPVMTPTP